MPNWKKVIISGSNAILNSVTADNYGLFLKGQNASYGVFPSNLNATSGFRIVNGKAYTYVTPQPTSKPTYFLGIQGAPTEIGGYNNNYITANRSLYFDPNESGGGGGNGDGSDGNPIKPGGTVSINSKLNVFQYRHDNYTGSEDPRTGVSITGNPSIYFFNSDSSGSISGSLVYASASAEIKFDTGSNAIKFFAGSTDETLKEVLHISKSGDNARIGIGTNSPKSTLDFKDIEDSSKGAQLLLRTSRTSVGAQTGDEGGSINFTIDSGSFNNIKTSGSLAKIKTKVDSVGNTGVQGKLVFELSKGALVSKDVFSYGFNQGTGTLGDFALYSQIQTASLLLKDFSAGGNSVIEMRDSSNNFKLQIGRGNITASGDISASGNIIGTINGGTF